MVKICREEGVFSVVDAAHSIGQEVGIDVGASGCDFWISVSSTSEYHVILPRLMRCLQNCHKWLFAERVCAMLYVPKRSVIAPAIRDSTRSRRCYFCGTLQEPTYHKINIPYSVLVRLPFGRTLFAVSTLCVPV
jgi:hypothetical protein